MDEDESIGCRSSMTPSAPYKLIAAERAYEYAMDDIRLTILSAPTIRERIRQVFDFESAEIVRPPITFGSVVRTSPPGLVFSLGEVVTAEGDFVVVRSLHVEPTRIVVSILDESELADAAFELLRETIAELGLSESDALLPDPESVDDRSEYSLRTDQVGQALETLLHPGYVSLMKQHLLGSSESDALLVSTLDTFVAPMGSGDPDDDASHRAGAFEIGPRHGTELPSGALRSVAPLSSTAHRRYLDALVEFLSRAATR